MAFLFLWYLSLIQRYSSFPIMQILSLMTSSVMQVQWCDTKLRISPPIMKQGYWNLALMLHSTKYIRWYTFSCCYATCSVPVSYLFKMNDYHLWLNKAKYLVLSKGAFVWDQSGIRIIGIMWVSVCLGAILIPEYLDSHSGYSAPRSRRSEYIPEYILIPEYPKRTRSKLIIHQQYFYLLFLQTSCLYPSSSFLHIHVKNIIMLKYSWFNLWKLSLMQKAWFSY